MTKPMVFNYADYERALEEIAKLKEDIANLQIRCRIAESEQVTSKLDLISREDAIDVIMGEPTDAHYPSWYADKIKSLPSRLTEYKTFCGVPIEEAVRIMQEHNADKPTGDIINRTDAIEAIASRDETDGTVKVFTGREVNGILSALPSADAIEVVRCKDCKYRHEDDCPMCYEEQYDIDEGDGYYDTDYIIHDYTQDDGYCSWGERKGGEDE